MTSKREWGIVGGLFLIVATLALVFQKPLTYQAGQGWDGVSYYQMAEQLARGQKPHAIGPFAYRLGTPAMVALFFPHQLLLGFRLVNLLACALATVLLAQWLRRFVALPAVRLALIAAFLTQWHAPLRFTAHYAAYTDPWLFVFLLAVLLTDRAPQAALCFLGALFREAVVVVPLALALTTRGRRWVPALAGVLGIAATHLLATQTDRYGFARTAGQWLYNKPLPVYLHGLCIAYGPALVLPLVFWRTSAAWLKGRPLLAAVLIALLVLGWVGGSDTERIVYWAMPVVYPLIGVILETQVLPRGFLSVLVLLQLLSHRVFWTLPDFPGPYPELWSYQASRTTQITHLAAYVLALTGLACWLRYARVRQ